MNALFLFLLKAALINALMLGFYHFAIRPGRNIRLMRMVLLLALLLPLLLPLMHLPGRQPGNTGIPVYVFSLPDVTENSVIITDKPGAAPLNLQQLLYGITAGAFLLTMAVSMLTIVRRYKRATPRSTAYGRVFLDNASKSPYSFFTWVFISDESLRHPDSDYLLRHEFSHVRHRHSIDRLFSGLFRSFFWFSPFAHINHKLLAEVHEYQADADAISSRDHAIAYNKLLLSFSTYPVENPVTNPFSAHLKKRIMMINNLKPRKRYITRIAAGITILAAFALFSSMIIPAVDNFATSPVSSSSLQPQQKAWPAMQQEDTISPAVFPGGEEARIKFFQDHIRYPGEAREKNIQGTVSFKVFIEPDGTVTSPSVISGIGGGCDEEVLRVAGMMPKWTPAYKDGKAVRTSVILPVAFALNDTGAWNTDEQIFTVVENPPRFRGGDEAMVAYLKKAVVYPEEARKQKIEGTVFISFVVETDGKISNTKVLRGIGHGCDESAVSAVEQMPPWDPGTQRGKAVRVQYNLPIRYSLGSNRRATAYDRQPDQPEGTNEIFSVVEKAPEFKGGQVALAAYMKSAVVYPEKARNDKTEGTVYVTFVIEKDGSVSGVKVLRGIGSGCDESAVAAIQHMPAWEPGMQRGQPVRVQFNMPVKFALDERKGPQNEKPKVSVMYGGREVYTIVDEAPAFPGGPEAMLAYLRTKTGHSHLAQANGKVSDVDVFMNLIVEPDGTVTPGGVSVPAGEKSDAFFAALKEMPRWSPGKKDGKTVPVMIHLYLSDEKNN